MLFRGHYKFEILVRNAVLILLLNSVVCQETRADWVAGRDLALNEQPDGAQELLNPNGTVPEWSYGYRSTIAGTALTLYSGASQHFNDRLGHTNFDGWWNGSSDGASTLVNAGANPVILNFGFGPNAPLAPLELGMGPAGNNDVAVVRWSAPAAGLYSVVAAWRDLDSHGGDGASADIVVNGTSIFHQDWANGGSAADSRDLNLLSGDTIDFVLGPRGNYTFDVTAFDASIALVPEASSLSLALLNCLVITRRSLWPNRRGN